MTKKKDELLLFVEKTNKQQKCFQKYVDKANHMFNNKYDYSKFIYINAKIKSIIICPIHGECIQNMDKHTALNSKGCAKCWDENRPHPIQFKKKEITDINIFKNRLYDSFENKFILKDGTYKGLSNKCTIICPIHGEIDILPITFFQSKSGCPKCGRESARKNMTKGFENFVKQSNKVHNNQYEYLDGDKYVNKKTKVNILCKVHGIFNKKAQKHVAGQGCMECSKENLIKSGKLIGGYSEDLFENNPKLKNNDCSLYLLKINNMYKIGITTKNVINRSKCIKSKAKRFGEQIDIEILKIEKDTLYNCFLKEQKILLENNDNRIYKKWSTELLKDIDVNKYFKN